MADGEEYLPGRLNLFLSRLTNLQLTEPLGMEERTEYGLEAPLATVTVITENGEGPQTRTLLIGAKDDNNNTYVVKWSDSDYFVRISEFNAKDFVETSRNDLVETVETNVEEGAPEVDESGDGE